MFLGKGKEDQNENEEEISDDGNMEEEDFDDLEDDDELSDLDDDDKGNALIKWFVSRNFFLNI